MIKMHTDINWNEQFYKLLRLSLGLSQEFPVDIDADGWRRLYQIAIRQSLVGICYKGVCLFPEDRKPPVEIVMQWAAHAESISGMNKLLYHEAARLTREFEEMGHQTAILKGQANARLYPDQYARQPGDIDIWVDGGRENVLALLKEMKLAETISASSEEGEATASYHHVHLPANEQGVTVEVHFRPSSGNFNPITNRRLQRWLEREIKSSEETAEGFNVPSIRFALVMQLAHIQRHFISGGIGLRQICDYYWLLQNSSPEDRRIVTSVLSHFGLRHTAMALMWVLGEVLRIDPSLLLSPADSRRGQCLLREIIAGGNFGQFAERQQHGVIKRVMEGRLRHLRLMKFDLWEIVWVELDFWKAVIKTLPQRIKYRTLSLRDVHR